MTNDGIVNIHGKDYMTVAKRLELARDEKAIEKIDTEVITTHDNHVVIKATVVIKGTSYTGISSVDITSNKLIEKQNPYEVAETSAVGRALGFAGYGVIEGIASADEMVKSGTQHRELADEPLPTEENEETKWCSVHGEPMVKEFSRTKRDANNNPKPYWSHVIDGKRCFGSGY